MAVLDRRHECSKSWWPSPYVEDLNRLVFCLVCPLLGLSDVVKPHEVADVMMHDVGVLFIITARTTCCALLLSRGERVENLPGQTTTKHRALVLWARGTPKYKIHRYEPDGNTLPQTHERPDPKLSTRRDPFCMSPTRLARSPLLVVWPYGADDACLRIRC